MSIISDETIRAVRERADIFEIASELTKLRKAGRNFVGLCPFHMEKNPSFNVRPDRQIFKCFSCNRGGDVFKLVAEYYHLDFAESIRHLADRYGIPIVEIKGGKGTDRSQREKMFAVLEKAASIFREIFEDPEDGLLARTYLSGRGINGASIRTFGIGFAPQHWDTLARKFRDEEKQIAVELGLLKQAERSSRSYDAFRNRIIFPIKNPSGKIVGFSGRILPGDSESNEPKYLNSPESQLFKKSSLLFGLHLAGRAISDQKMAVICEGHIDLIKLHQYGFTHSVAVQGSALTLGHLELLRRYTPNIVLLFDGDQAGQKAMERALEIALETDLSIRAAVLPAGEDPDSFLSSKGPDQLHEVIIRAPSLVEFGLDRIIVKCGSDLDGRSRAANEATALMIKSSSSVRQDLMIKYVAQKLNIDPMAIQRELKKRFKPGYAGPKTSQYTNLCAPLGAEEILVAALIQHGNLIVEDRENLELAIKALKDPLLAIVAEKLIDGIAFEEILEQQADSDAVSKIAGLACCDYLDDPDDARIAISDAIKSLSIESVQQKIEDLVRALNSAYGERLQELTLKKYELQQQLDELRRSYSARS